MIALCSIGGRMALLTLRFGIRRRERRPALPIDRDNRWSTLRVISPLTDWEQLAPLIMKALKPSTPYFHRIFTRHLISISALPDERTAHSFRRKRCLHSSRHTCPDEEALQWRF